MTDEEKGNTAVTGAKVRDHDRVAMLSVSKDGTFDQHEPELIGDKDATLEATREQFRQQAVSNVDAELRAPYVAPASDEDVEEDPTVAELREAHEGAEKAADKAAESAVDALTIEDKGRTETTNKPTGASPTTSDAGTPKGDAAAAKSASDKS